MATVSDKIRRAKPLLGTFVVIEVTAADKLEMNAAINVAFEAIADVHRLMSFHEPCSDIGRLNREACHWPVKVHEWTFQVLEAAIELHAISNGIFDVTVAPALQATGLLPRPQAQPAGVFDARSCDAIELLPDRMVRFRKPRITVDLGGIAKGFAVDRAVEVLRRFNIVGGVVNAGGDLAVFGEEPQTID